VRGVLPRPYVRLDHPADEALRALDALIARWERFERRRLALVLPPARSGGLRSLHVARGKRDSGASGARETRGQHPPAPRASAAEAIHAA
jgi:hypothetical protein